MKTEGKEKPVALVTGGSRGIGRAISMAFAEKGYRVAVNYAKSVNEAASTVEGLEAAGAEAVGVRADVGDAAQVKKMVHAVMDRWGRIDVLVNNAGIARDRSILKMSDEEWNEVLRVNLTGSFYCLRECAKVMCRQKEGTLINISSIVGVKGAVGDVNYAASKAGVIGLTKGAARELGRFNVRVHAVLPGFHYTDLGRTVEEDRRGRILSAHVLGRLTELDELSRFVAGLPDLKSVSGQVFNLDSRII